jgi:hypothetical protein
MCLFRRRNVDFVRADEFGIRHFGFQSHVLVGWFLIRGGEKREFVLMVEPIREFIQVRCESDWRLKALEVRFASGLVSKPREVVLSRIDSPEAMARMPGA